MRVIGNQLGEAARVHHGSRKLVRAELAAFFEDVDIFGGEFGFAAGFVVRANQTREMERAGEAGRASAYDQDIGVELFAGLHFFELRYPHPPIYFARISF